MQPSRTGVCSLPDWSVENFNAYIPVTVKVAGEATCLDWKWNLSALPGQEDIKPVGNKYLNQYRIHGEYSYWAHRNVKNHFIYLILEINPYKEKSFKHSGSFMKKVEGTQVETSAENY